MAIPLMNPVQGAEFQAAQRVFNTNSLEEFKENEKIKKIARIALSILITSAITILATTAAAGLSVWFVSLGVNPIACAIMVLTAFSVPIIMGTFGSYKREKRINAKNERKIRTYNRILLGLQTLIELQEIRYQSNFDDIQREG